VVIVMLMVLATTLISMIYSDARAGEGTTAGDDDTDLHLYRNKGETVEARRPL
jgi:hypothetical protein